MLIGPAIATFAQSSVFVYAISENNLTLLGVSGIGAVGAVVAARTGTRNQARIDRLERKLREKRQ